MAVYEDREAFIPYRRTDLIELCIEDGKLSPADVPFATLVIFYQLIIIFISIISSKL